jgi:SPW repeat
MPNDKARFIVQGPAEATQDCCPMAPWILGFASEHVAAPNAWVSGIVIGAVATAALTKLAEWEVWINFLLGVWVLVSPWGAEFLGAAGREGRHSNRFRSRRMKPEAINSTHNANGS